MRIGLSLGAVGVYTGLISAILSLCPCRSLILEPVVFTQGELGYYQCVDQPSLRVIPTVYLEWSEPGATSVNPLLCRVTDNRRALTVEIFNPDGVVNCPIPLYAVASGRCSLGRRELSALVCRSERPLRPDRGDPNLLEEPLGAEDGGELAGQHKSRNGLFGVVAA
jgi:hypothetical protein